MIENIRALGHGSFLIQSNPIIYINPWKIASTPFLADVILVGHDHYDHFSPVDIDRLRAPNTQVISNAKVAQQYPHATVLREWQYAKVDRATIRTIPAYSPNDIRHPRADGGLGFIISLNFYDIYYTGDTQWIPEMETIRPDILILPIDDNGTFSIMDALEAVQKLRPRWVIPCNWGVAGAGVTRKEAQEFKHLVGGRAEVVLPERLSL